MNSLHILKSSSLPVSSTVSEADSLILIQEACYLALDNAFLSQYESHTVYVIKKDAIARGLSCFSDKVIAVDYADFVELTLSHQNTISW